jgi:hypothetical protein
MRRLCSPVTSGPRARRAGRERACGIRPLAIVSADTPETVTFGVPAPRGSVGRKDRVQGGVRKCLSRTVQRRTCGS